LTFVESRERKMVKESTRRCDKRSNLWGAGGRCEGVRTSGEKITLLFNRRERISSIEPEKRVRGLTGVREKEVGV